MNIEELAKNYKPDDAGIKVARDAKMLFLVGIMSAGKDAIKDGLLEKQEYSKILTHTTRQPRVNNGVLERNGEHYWFISFDKMADMLKSHQMIEANHFGENYYGTSVNELNQTVRSGDIAIGSIDVNGVQSFYNIAPQSTTAVFVVPPSYDIWIERIKSRYGSINSFNIEWEKRRDITINEIEFALKTPYYFFVVNDDLNETVKLIDNIAHHDAAIIESGDAKAREIAINLLEAIKRTI